MKKKLYTFLLTIIICSILTPDTLSGQGNNSSITDTSYFKPDNDDINLLRSVIRNFPGNTAMLLQRGADPNTKSSTGNSPLMYAAEKGNVEIMKMLVENGAEVNVTGFNSETPLFLTIFNNDFQSTKFLLEHGADPNIKDHLGVTPLIYAAATNQYQSADLLMFYHAKPDLTDAEGNDPLLAAVTFENVETSDVLLQNGLNPDVQDKMGNTPSIVATQHGTYNLMELLLEYNADVNIANKKNYTPLAYAITYNDVKAVQMLIKKGADVNHKVDKGRNMSDLARVTGNDTLIDMIRENGGVKTPGVDFSEFDISFGNSFNRTDYLMHFRGGFVDTKYGYFFETGIDYRPFLLKIRTTINDTAYQFRERRIGWSHSIGKYQRIYQSPGGLQLSLYGSLNGYLSFPQYMGTSSRPKIDYKIIPSAGLVLSGNYIGLKTGADYYNFENQLDKGLKFNVTIFFRISYPEVNYDRKEIYWE